MINKSNVLQKTNENYPSNQFISVTCEICSNQEIDGIASMCVQYTK